MRKSQAGTLVRVLSSLRREPIELHALYPTRRSKSGKVRAFVDALIAGPGATADAFILLFGIDANLLILNG